MHGILGIMFVITWLGNEEHIPLLKTEGKKKVNMPECYWTERKKDGGSSGAFTIAREETAWGDYMRPGMLGCKLESYRLSWDEVHAQSKMEKVI